MSAWLITIPRNLSRSEYRKRRREVRERGRDDQRAGSIVPAREVFMKNRGVFVRKRDKTSFDPKEFLAKVGEGKTISKYRKDQIVFSQGQVADAVFYIQQGKVKLTVVSEQGKEAVVAILGPGHFLAKDV
jgi:Cyclic nucleotide-binding domain